MASFTIKYFQKLRNSSYKAVSLVFKQLLNNGQFSVKWSCFLISPDRVIISSCKVVRGDEEELIPFEGHVVQ